MTCNLPVVWKLWEKECFMARELGFIPHVIKGHSVDGRCLLPDIFFHLMIQVTGFMWQDFGNRS